MWLFGNPGFIRVTYLCRTTAGDKFLVSEDMFDGGIEAVTVPVINFVGNRIIHTAAVPLPVGIGID